MAFGSVRRGLHRSVAVGEEGPHINKKIGSSLFFNLISGPWVGLHGGVADPIRCFGIPYQYSLLVAFMLLVICPLLQNSYLSLVLSFIETPTLLPLQSSQHIFTSSLSQTETSEFPVCSSEAGRTSSAILLYLDYFSATSILHSS